MGRSQNWPNEPAREAANIVSRTCRRIRTDRPLAARIRTGRHTESSGRPLRQIQSTLKKRQVYNNNCEPVS